MTPSWTTVIVVAIVAWYIADKRATQKCMQTMNSGPSDAVRGMRAEAGAKAAFQSVLDQTGDIGAANEAGRAAASAAWSP